MILYLKSDKLTSQTILMIRKTFSVPNDTIPKLGISRKYSSLHSSNQSSKEASSNLRWHPHLALQFQGLDSTTNQQAEDKASAVVTKTSINLTLLITVANTHTLI